MKIAKNKTLRVIVAFVLTILLGLSSTVSVFTTNAETITATNEQSTTMNGVDYTDSNLTGDINFGNADKVDGNGEDYNYPNYENRKTVISTPSMDISYIEGETYFLDICINPYEPFASFQFEIYLPEFLRIEQVLPGNSVDTSTDTKPFVSNILDDGCRAIVVYSSSSDDIMNRDYDATTLAQIEFSIRECDSFSGVPSIYNTTFTKSDATIVNDVVYEISSINVNANGENPPSQNLIKGDVNGDTIIDIADLMLMQRAIAQIEVLYGDATYRADINNDGHLDIVDCQYMQMYITGRIGSLENIGGGDQGGNEGMYNVSLHFYTIKDNSRNYFDKFTVSVNPRTSVGEIVSSYKEYNGYQLNTIYADVDFKNVLNMTTRIDYNGFAIYLLFNERETNNLYLTFMYNGKTAGSLSTKIDTGMQVLTAVNSVVASNYNDPTMIKGVYYDYEMNNQVTASEVYLDGHTLNLYVDVDAQYQVRVILYIKTGDYTSSSTISIFETSVLVGEKVTLSTVVDKFRNYESGFAGVYNAKEMEIALDESQIITSDMGIGILFDQSIKENVVVHIYTTGIEVADFRGHLEAGKNILEYITNESVNRYGEFGEIEGVYTNLEMTTRLDEKSIMDESGEVLHYYVNLEMPSVVGNYNVKKVVVTDNGEQVLTDAGTLTFINETTGTYRKSSEVIKSFEYVNVAGEIVAYAGEYEMYAFEVETYPTETENGSLYLFIDFDGSQFEESEEFIAVAGAGYTVVSDGADLMSIELCANGVAKVLNVQMGIYVYCDYIVEGNKIVLSPDGSIFGAPMPLIIDVENKTLTMDSSSNVGGGNGNTDEKVEIAISQAQLEYATTLSNYKNFRASTVINDGQMINSIEFVNGTVHLVVFNGENILAESFLDGEDFYEFNTETKTYTKSAVTEGNAEVIELNIMPVEQVLAYAASIREENRHFNGNTLILKPSEETQVSFEGMGVVENLVYRLTFVDGELTYAEIHFNNSIDGQYMDYNMSIDIGNASITLPIIRTDSSNIFGTI